MAQKKAHEVESWLARPSSEVSIVLLYGPDRGLVSERARIFAEKSGLPLDDPFSVIKLDASEIDKDAGRLIDEVRTVPMFATRRLVWLRNAGIQKAISDAVKLLAAEPQPDAIVLIEGGDLKKGVALRTVVEGAFCGMALPCYADETREIETIIDDEMQKAGLSISLDARQALRANLGGDRLASRGEVQKLALYALDKGEVTLDDVKSMTGDVAALSMDEAIDAALDGDIQTFDTAFTRQCQTPSQAGQLLGAAIRYVQSLHAMRGEMEKRLSSASSVVAAQRPPVFYGRKKAVERAITRWNGEGLGRALERLQATTLQSRQRADLAIALTRQALLALAVEGARRAQRSR
ncbi:DNA polymerase III subunit delta [Oryzicola mucosus]|uniref:DNA-directed DNA polymerase n=1 Tax=Oryzicola mucosus TaxID=2767425 RepID=A0A8J6U475_9HYPH|nr:DNA polymerase III subunit delta [Oryzicola mucosus]MBD0413770.1 DNA polymerase III subunit delta [Oryzicola mucosus]